jgi:hypothetical protein
VRSVTAKLVSCRMAAGTRQVVRPTPGTEVRGVQRGPG